MIHPASDKFLALSCVCGESGGLTQGQVLKLVDNGDGRLKALKATATTDVSNFGTFLAYSIAPDSEDVEFVGAPESTTFTLNTDTGVGGGTHTIASGTEMIALGGSKVALVRFDKNSLYNTPASLASYVPGTILEVEAAQARLALASDGDLNVNAGLVVQNDTVTIVVLLA